MSLAAQARMAAALRSAAWLNHAAATKLLQMQTRHKVTATESKQREAVQIWGERGDGGGQEGDVRAAKQPSNDAGN